MKKRSEMTVEEKMNFILDGATWEEAKEVGCLILGKVVAKAVHVDGNKDIFHELFETVAKKGDQWVQEGGSWYLAIAKASKRLETDEMTNDEKASIISNGCSKIYKGENGDYIFSKPECYDAAISMADWKDSEFSKEKKELVDKACDKYRKDIIEIQNLLNRVKKLKGLIDIDGSVDDFRKAIGGGSL